MYAAASRFEGTVVPFDADPPQAPALERAEGTVRVSIAAENGRSRLDRCYQRGSMKIRFPRQTDTDVPEGVLLNTAGGITGGDRFSVQADLDTGAALTLTSQAAEKIYRSPGGDGSVDVSLTAGEGTTFSWLPQETILYDAGRVRRTLDVAMEPDATVVLGEAVILGRAAHGETVREGLLADRWRIRRGGKLVYADNLILIGGGGATAEGKAMLAGGKAFASFLVIAPDSETRIDAARDALETCPITSGASAWDGMLSARMVAADGATLRKSMITFLTAIGVRVPRAWSI